MPETLRFLLAIVLASIKDRADLVAENLVLRPQLASLAHARRQPKLRPIDRFMWGLLSQRWSRWRERLVIVKPATVLRWHRRGFRLFWSWKSC